MKDYFDSTLVNLLMSPLKFLGITDFQIYPSKMIL